MKLAYLVKSKYFCYFTYALMVINLLGYVSTGAMECVVVFALATFACKSCLSKNMCLCIFGGLFVSNILFGCSKVREGLKTDLSVEECKEKTKDAVDAEKADCAEAAKELQDKLDKCEADAAAAVDDEEVVDGGSGTGGTLEETGGDGAFRNMRRNRRRAVREAFSTIHRAVRSY